MKCTTVFLHSDQRLIYRRLWIINNSQLVSLFSFFGFPIRQIYNDKKSLFLTTEIHFRMVENDQLLQTTHIKASLIRATDNCTVPFWV